MQQYQSDLFCGVLDFNIPVYSHVTSAAFLASWFLEAAVAFIYLNDNLKRGGEGLGTYMYFYARGTSV